MANLLLLVSINICFVYTAKSTEVNERNGTIELRDEDAVPLILIPGIGGTELKAKIDRSQVRVSICMPQVECPVWPNRKMAEPALRLLWLNDIKLSYDNYSRTTSNRKGVDIVVPGHYADTFAFMRLNNTPYFGEFVTQAEHMGYKRVTNLFGAAYDCRKAPNEQQIYFDRLKATIEFSFRANRRKAAICCHSMGCLYSLYFLNLQTPSWKDKYVHSFITLAAPWGGSVTAVKAFLMGHDFNIGHFIENIFMQAQRTFPSTAFLMPNPNVFGSEFFFKDTRKFYKSYNVHNYKQLFEDYNQTDFYEMWKDTNWLVSDLKHPGVDVFCIHGTNVATLEKIAYEGKENSNREPMFFHGHGDGTANHKSLRACLRWAKNKKHTFRYETFSGLNHIETVTDERVIFRTLRYLNN